MVQFYNMTGEPEPHLRVLGNIFQASDPRPAAEQIDARYSHGGGWRPFPGFKLRIDEPGDPATWALHYPGEKPLKQVARAELGDETLLLFEHEWLAVVKPDGSYHVNRMD